MQCAKGACYMERSTVAHLVEELGVAHKLHSRFL